MTVQVQTLALSAKEGDEVLVQRMMSWCIPQPDKPDYKRDINVGQESHYRLEWP